MLHNSKRKASEQWEFTKKAKTGADEAAGVVLHSDTWIARISASLSQIDVLLLHISETSAVAEGAEIEAELAEENEAEEAERAEEREESEEACTEDPEERAECTEEPEERAECTEEPEGRAECTEEPEGRAEPEERAEDAGGFLEFYPGEGLDESVFEAREWPVIKDHPFQRWYSPPRN